MVPKDSLLNLRLLSGLSFLSLFLRGVAPGGSESAVADDDGEDVKPENESSANFIDGVLKWKSVFPSEATASISPSAGLVDCSGVIGDDGLLLWR